MRPAFYRGGYLTIARRRFGPEGSSSARGDNQTWYSFAVQITNQKGADDSQTVPHGCGDRDRRRLLQLRDA
jgi:hypothetical protein